MKQINKVSIALKPNVYSTFRNLNNTVSNTLGEYVDNAVQSFLNHKTELFDLESNYKLRIEISVDWENRTILISDNAAGIDAVNYQRAFEPAHIPLDDTGLNEFGMGMKTASVWLANKWCVYTKALGEDVERFTEFDLQKVTTEEKEELVVIEKNAPANVWKGPPFRWYLSLFKAVLPTIHYYILYRTSIFECCFRQKEA